MNKVSAILLAGGTGSRMQSTIPKQCIEIAGKRLIDFSYEILLTHPEIAEVIVVTDTEEFPLKAPAGKRRQDSVLSGIKLAKEKRVLIHDSARPLLTHDVIDRLLAVTADAVVPVVPVKDTIKRDQNGAISTLPREELFAAQTPQLINRDLLLKALSTNIEVTDDASAIEKVGGSVKLVEGSEKLFKITTQHDLNMLGMLLNATV